MFVVTFGSDTITHTGRVEGVGAVDAQLGEGAGQVPRAAAATERRVSGLLGVQRRGQWRREVQAGQIRQRAARI